jgi:hypothetical protein
MISSQRDYQPSIQGSKAASPTTDEESFHLTETKARRLRELSLLHNYIISTSQEILTSGDQVAELAWVTAVPQQSLKNDALLYTMFALSALHMTETRPDDEELLLTHRQYLALALSEHKKDVMNLNEVNLDAILLTSTLLRITAFAMLRERPLAPYTPPFQWLEMTRGTINLFKASWDFIGKDENSLGFKLTKRMPILFDEETKFAASNREGLEHLLHRKGSDLIQEEWSPEVIEAYETTVSYIGCVLIAAREKIPTQEICRRLIIFPYIVRSKYIELVKLAQPRALAILAHYFAILDQYRNVWWLGRSGTQEIHALNEVLTGRWSQLMVWPMQRLSEQLQPVPASTLFS